MSKIYIEASKVIEASPEKLYTIMADYHHGHVAILPKEYFKEVVVEKGGVGVGTVMRVRMKVNGAEFNYHLEVTEAEPGKFLVEKDLEKGLITTFTFSPLENGKQTEVKIATESTPSKGFIGLLEKLFTPSIMRKIYNKELELLADYARNQQTRDSYQLLS